MLRQRPAGAERVPEYRGDVGAAATFAAAEDDSPNTESRVVSWLERQDSAPPSLGGRLSEDAAAWQSTPKPWRASEAQQVRPTFLLVLAAANSEWPLNPALRAQEPARTSSLVLRRKLRLQSEAARSPMPTASASALAPRSSQQSRTRSPARQAARSPKRTYTPVPAPEPAWTPEPGRAPARTPSPPPSSPTAMAGGRSTPVSMVTSAAPSADGSTALQAVVELLHRSPRQATARIASSGFEQLVCSQPTPRLLQMLEHVGSRLERRGDIADARALGVIRQLAERRGAVTSPTPSFGDSTVMDDGDSVQAALKPVVCGQCGQRNGGGAFCSECGARRSPARQEPAQAGRAAEVFPSHQRLAQEEAAAREQAHQAANARGFYRLLYKEVRSGREHSEEVDGDIATGRAMDRVLGLLRSEEGRWAAVAPRLDFVYLLCSQASPQLLSMLEHNQRRVARAHRTADSDTILTLIAAVRATLDGVTADNPANSATVLQTMHSPTLRQPGGPAIRGSKEVEELAQGMQELNVTLQVATGMAAQLGELSPAGDLSFQSDGHLAGVVGEGAPTAGAAELELDTLVNEAIQSWGGGSRPPPPSANDDGHEELLRRDEQLDEAGGDDGDEEEDEEVFDEEIAKALADAAASGDGSALVSQWIDDTAGVNDCPVGAKEGVAGAEDEAAGNADPVEEPASPVLTVAFKPTLPSAGGHHRGEKVAGQHRHCRTWAHRLRAV